MTKLDEKDIDLIVKMIPELYDFDSYKRYVFSSPKSQEWYTCNPSCGLYHHTHWFTHVFGSTTPEKNARFTWYTTGKNLGEELSELLPDNPKIVLGGAGSEISPFYLVRFLDKLNDERQKQKKHQMNPTVTVVDICKTPLNRVEKTLKNYNGNVTVKTIHASLSKANLEDESQDWFTSDLFWPYTEMKEREDCLRNVYRFLKPSGLLTVREFISLDMGKIRSAETPTNRFKKFEGNVDYFLKHYFGEETIKDPAYSEVRKATLNLYFRTLDVRRGSHRFKNIDEVLKFFEKYSTLKFGKLYSTKLGEQVFQDLFLMMEKKSNQ